MLYLPKLGEHCEVKSLSSSSTSGNEELAVEGVVPPSKDNFEESVREVEPDVYIPLDSHWLRLADCESGNWIDGGRDFEEGSARWDWAAPGMEVPPWGTTIHHGGLQFHPDTWSWVAPMVGLGHIEFAYQATPQEQVQVAEKVQELQGWEAWPTCARMLGLY